MKYGVYAIHDRLTGYLSPTVDQNDPSAARNFAHAVLRSGSLMESHPGDYSLFRIGDYDAETGRITPLQDLVPIADASSVVRRNIIEKENFL